MKKYDAVVFDLDGTLLDTIDDLADCVNLALSEEGFACRTVSEVKSFVGNGIVKLIDRSVPEGTSEEEKSRALESFKRHYAVGCENKTKPYDGILKLLDDLRGKGFKIAVVSNKIDSAVSVLCEKYFGGRIDFAWNAVFRRERVGDVPTEMFRHFFKSFADAARCNLHITAEGENEHHKIEGIFKAFSRALRMAASRNSFKFELPSSKGVL